MSTDTRRLANGQAQQPEPIRVLIVDDHAVVRQGLRTFLALHDDVPHTDPSALPIEVVADASNGLEAVDLARRLQPDVILLDLVMPQMDGIEATPRIIAHSPHSRIIILTSFGDEDKVFSSIQKLLEEDNSLKLTRNAETKEILLSGVGSVHIEATVEKLKR